VKQEIVDVNPCAGVDRNPTSSRERVLSDAEIKLLWPRLDPGLKLILLTAQRPGEVSAMEKDHVVAHGHRGGSTLQRSTFLAGAHRASRACSLVRTSGRSRRCGTSA
jgi:integrase